uniref:TIP120 domain-containing protein n=1 Tax=Rodentolepis nana TaxID=102285 RepID=A0A0R3TBT0_RODNA
LVAISGIIDIKERCLTFLRLISLDEISRGSIFSEYNLHLRNCLQVPPLNQENRATVSDIPISLNSSNASLSLLTLKERYAFANLLLKERCFLDIMNLFNHADPDVCRAALLTLNTAEYYWPPIIRSLGDSGTLLDALYTATKVRPELIRTVQIGPFKVDFDDGKDLRKVSNNAAQIVGRQGTCNLIDGFLLWTHNFLNRVNNLE